jgi:threonine dehydratase
MALSLAAGKVVTTETAGTFVDRVACRAPDAEAISVISAGATRVLTVSEDAAAEAMRVLSNTTHNVAEPAGALALAGLLSERSWAAGKRVAVVHTGGNADADLLVQVLSGHTPAVRAVREGAGS